MITTYQANKLLVARPSGAGLSMLVRTFHRPMGLAVDGGRLALGTRDQVWQFCNAADIAPHVESAGTTPVLCRAPHTSPATSAYTNWRGCAANFGVMNTRFSCLCTLDDDCSFVPRWGPPFVSAFVAEDRCHLNGLAVVDGQPTYVTAWVNAMPPTDGGPTSRKAAASWR